MADRLEFNLRRFEGTTITVTPQGENKYILHADANDRYQAVDTQFTFDPTRPPEADKKILGFFALSFDIIDPDTNQLRKRWCSPVYSGIPTLEQVANNITLFSYVDGQLDKTQPQNFDVRFYSLKYLQEIGIVASMHVIHHPNS